MSNATRAEELPEEEIQRAWDSAREKVGRDILHMRADAGRLLAEADDIDRLADGLVEAWRKERAWEFAGLLTRAEGDVLARYEGWGVEALGGAANPRRFAWKRDWTMTDGWVLRWGDLAAHVARGAQAYEWWLSDLRSPMVRDVHGRPIQGASTAAEDAKKQAEEALEVEALGRLWEVGGNPYTAIEISARIHELLGFAEREFEFAKGDPDPHRYLDAADAQIGAAEELWMTALHPYRDWKEWGEAQERVQESKERLRAARMEVPPRRAANPAFVPDRQLSEDLVITALEGGSNYWYWLPDLSMVPAAKELKEPLSIRIFRAADAGAKIPVQDLEERRLLGHFTKEGMARAYELMREKHPRHYRDLVEENWDADTADVWFQLAVMGELVYG